MRLIRKLHLYTGLVLSLALLLIAISGALLLYKHEFWQLQYESLRAEERAHSNVEMATAVRMAWHRFGAEMQSLKMPEEGVPAYHVYLADHREALLNQDDFSITHEWQLRERPMGFLFDLHAHLLAGHPGGLVAGAIGMIGALMSITGLLLWWPTRRAFSWRNLWPRNTSRGRLLAWHRDMGVVASPLLLLFILSGSAMVFYAQARTLLNAAFGDPVPALKLPLRPSIDLDDVSSVPLPGPDVFARVTAHFPDAELKYFYTDSMADGLHRFRLRRNCELHPNGMTFLYADARTGEVVHVVDACAMPVGERLTQKIYPVHAAKLESEFFRSIGLVVALVLAGSALTGCTTYGQQLLRKKRRNRTTQPPVPSASSAKTL